MNLMVQIIMSHDPHSNNQFDYIRNIEEPISSPMTFHPFFHKVTPRILNKRNEAKRMLESEGFKGWDSIKELVKRTVAFPGTITNSHIISYHVDDMSITDYGLRIFQKNPNMKFVTYKEHKKEVTEQSIEEIFLPYHLLQDVLIRDSGFEVNTYKNNNYKKKEYVEEKDIIVEAPFLYESICDFIERKKIDDLDILSCEVQNLLENEGIPSKVSYRHKNIEGIYSKLLLNKGNLSLENLYDMNGISIQVEHPNHCHIANKVINSFYQIHFYWDYIAEPKPNGFQCLLCHTDSSLSLETQIRTFHMYDVAENGNALDYRGGKFNGK